MTRTTRVRLTLAAHVVAGALLYANMLWELGLPQRFAFPLFVIVILSMFFYTSLLRDEHESRRNSVHVRGAGRDGESQ